MDLLVLSGRHLDQLITQASELLRKALDSRLGTNRASLDITNQMTQPITGCEEPRAPPSASAMAFPSILSESWLRHGSNTLRDNPPSARLL